ncbi:TPA: hypothetical protein ACN782_005549, partial [Klebsiella pneumoniae]|uniref:hypothetical protein n=5 Tax=Klebsiella pneumoniae TaxID=573 RepID=UPI0032AFE5C0
APVFIMLPPRGRLKASLSVAFKGGLFLHKMQVLLLHLNPRRDRGFLSPPWTAHKVQQLFLHLVKRLPTIAAIVYSKLLQFCGDDRHKWP